MTDSEAIVKCVRKNPPVSSEESLREIPVLPNHAATRYAVYPQYEFCETKWHDQGIWPPPMMKMRACQQPARREAWRRVGEDVLPNEPRNPLFPTVLPAVEANFRKNPPTTSSAPPTSGHENRREIPVLLNQPKTPLFSMTVAARTPVTHACHGTPHAVRCTLQWRTLYSARCTPHGRPANDL